MSKERVVLDTNILVSAVVFGGNSEIILKQALNKEIVAITSPPLLNELSEVLFKKFPILHPQIKPFLKKLRKSFLEVEPLITITLQKDEPDNRVLEAALTGKCQYIITGDKALLALGSYQKIAIITPAQFLAKR